jgi:uncharacterized protein
MPTMYKTPGVSVEEITKFPPSIAPVETAIPAFIGYTEKALRNGESLLNKPVRVESIAEYEEIFGLGPSQAIEVYLDSNNNYFGAKKSKGFLLYDSLALFYSNGGGNCYIVSIGSYKDSITKQPLLDGIDKIGNEDEPTILLFPDAVNLSGKKLPESELHDVQVKALAQCAKLQDRVTLCDTVNTGKFKDDVQTLRNGIGINNLKYGAAYGPWINSSLSKSVNHRDVTLKRDNSSGALIPLESLTTDDKIKQLLSDVSKSEIAVTYLSSKEELAADAGKTWSDALKSKLGAYDASTETTLTNLENELQGIYDLLATILAEVKDMVDLPTILPSTDFSLKTDIDKFLISSKLKESSFDILAAYNKCLAGSIDLFSEDPTDPTTNLGKAIALAGYTDAGAFTAVTLSDVSTAYAAAGTDKAKADLARNAAMNAGGAIIALYRYAQNSAAEYEKKFNSALISGFGVYKNIIGKAIESLNLLPPSGAIAGVYASVDRDRGVWKAPANVSLNSVITPAEKISSEQQGEYNVDVNAGKSINIIRTFQGKGVLVWGARTLAGNDNEWRYVSVRRFFNFVEESTKKATEQFVFEPNDANTWVRLQAMIENFLTVLWRQGALQGVKPEHAFYVAVGLGKTMTQLDILEGRLIIEIGMAAVRPAEFIILRFSHKMAES